MLYRRMAPRAADGPCHFAGDRGERAASAQKERNSSRLFSLLDIGALDGRRRLSCGLEVEEERKTWWVLQKWLRWCIYIRAASYLPSFVRSERSKKCLSSETDHLFPCFKDSRHMASGGGGGGKVEEEVVAICMRK